MKYHLQLIGEACRSLDPATRRLYPAVPWEKIIGLRNIPIHDYGAVNLGRIWTIVEDHVPALKTAVEGILADDTIG